MKIRYFPAILFAAAAPVMGAEEVSAGPTINLYNRTELLFQETSGLGKAQSFYDPGNHVFHETDIVANGRVGNWNSLFNATVRYTDTRQYDPVNLSTPKLMWQLSDAQNQINFGDYFAVFSPYSLTKSIKGAAIQHNFSDDQNYIRAAYGSFDGQWSYLFRNPNNEPMDRYGGGVRVQQAADNWRIGASLVQAADRWGDPRRGMYDGYRQVMPAIDWEWRTPGWLFSGEHAYAATTVNSGTTGATSDLNGSANRFTFRGNLRDVSLDGLLERVGSRFATLGGGATPDRMRTMLRGDWRLGALWRFNAMADYYYNDLDHQLATRTTVKAIDVGTTRRRLFDRRSASLSLGLKTRWTETDDNTSETRTDRLKLRFKDRYFDEALDLSLGLEKTINDVRQGATPGSNDSYLYDIGLGWRAALNRQWTLRTNLDLGHTELQNPTNGNFDIMDTVRLAIAAEATDRSQFGVSVDYGGNRMTIANANSQVDRHSVFYQAQPAWTGGGTVRAELTENTYRFDVASNNFRERLLRLVFNWNLDIKPR